MSQFSSIIFPNPLITFALTGLLASYGSAPVGSVPNSTRLIKFKNTSVTNPLTISWDGVQDHENLQPGEFLLIDVSANKENATNIFEIKEGQAFWAKGIAGAGNLYISSYYAY